MVIQVVLVTVSGASRWTSCMVFVGDVSVLAPKREATDLHENGTPRLYSSFGLCQPGGGTSRLMNPPGTASYPRGGKAIRAAVGKIRRSRSTTADPEGASLPHQTWLVVPEAELTQHRSRYELG